MDAAAEGASFGRSLKVQLRVLRALLLREMITRYGRANLGFAWLFVENILFTLGITAIWFGFRLGHVSAVPIVAFALAGYSSVLVWRNSVARASTAIPPNVGLLYHRNVRVLDLMLTRILLEIAGATVSFITLGAFWVAIGWCELPQDGLKVFAAWLLLAWFGAALALAIGALSSVYDIVERLWPPISYLLFPLSGAMFMVDWLPKEFQDVVLWLPMVHGVEFLRDGMFGHAVRTHYDLEYLIGTSLVLTFVGLVLLKNAARRIEFQ